MILVVYDKLCIYNIIPRVTTKKAMQVHSKTLSRNQNGILKKKKKKFQVTHMKAGERRQRSKQTITQISN